MAPEAFTILKCLIYDDSDEAIANQVAVLPQ